jgi:hypothetical protein
MQRRTLDFRLREVDDEYVVVVALGFGHYNRNVRNLAIQDRSLLAIDAALLEPGLHRRHDGTGSLPQGETGNYFSVRQLWKKSCFLLIRAHRQNDLRRKVNRR